MVSITRTNIEKDLGIGATPIHFRPEGYRIAGYDKVLATKYIKYVDCNLGFMDGQRKERRFFSRNLLKNPRNVIVATLVALIMCFSYVVIVDTVDTSATIEYEVDGINYRVLSEADKRVTISGNSFQSSVLTIPGTVELNGETYTVSSIGPYAFQGNRIISSLTIPATVERIGLLSFSNCTNLESVTISQGVKYVANYAFKGCPKITFMHIPASVTSIGSDAFSDCSNISEFDVDPLNTDYCSIDGIIFNKTVTELVKCPEAKEGTVTLPNTINSIAYRAFENCRSIESVNFNKYLESIGDYAFIGCESLTVINMGPQIKSIGNMAFNNCSNLEGILVDKDNNSYASIDGCLYDKGVTTLIKCPGAYAGPFVLPETVNEIMEEAFKNCARLISFSATAHLEIVHNSAFEGCASLTEVHMPHGARVLSISAFKDCTHLSDVTLNGNVEQIHDYCFQNCESLPSLFIPTDVISLKTNVFDGCTSLESLSVSEDNTMYSSHNGALLDKGMTSLILCPVKLAGSFTIPDSVEYIESGAFKNCSEITAVNFGSGVKTVGDQAFSHCTSLESVIMLDGVESMGSYVFDHCTSLKALIMPDSVESTNTFLMSGCTSLEHFKLSAGMETLPSGFFYGCSKLQSIDIPSSITSLGFTAFFECTSLKSFTIHKGLTSIQTDTFYRCAGLEEFIVSEDNTVFDSVDGVLFTNEKKTLFIYPAGKTGEYRIPDFVNSIVPGAFNGCAGLNKVIIHNRINPNEIVFVDCVNLTDVVIEEPNDLLTSSDGLMYNNDMSKLMICPAGKKGSITLPDNIKEIEYLAFYKSALDEIKIPRCNSIHCGGNSFFLCNEDIKITSAVEGYSVEAYMDEGMTVPLDMELLSSGWSGNIYFKWTDTSEDNHTTNQLTTIVIIILVFIVALAVIYLRS